ncbi:ABC transporter ATP-binding protein [Bradyrhizobium sp. LHD-71]|uniref:ABC transporter ATP-binding protein n=1 Tax=Bradyrhizobium sp. LHD-71 TaxID=3072141 RepID=UPI00280FACBF|nr:ABC transporter ATP-binding protein [Bradyrhizobium sp. LHD-71]MDQ8727351.1 ABC transporter ATP-binding protein [Bradyrhizobium sp. LHD-71]
MLQVHNLIAGYGPLTALNDVSLSLQAGARLGVFGHNGAGKTTLLRCIMGAVRPVSGRVEVDSNDTCAATVADNVRRGIAFVPQGHNVFPNLSVEQNLRIAGLLFDPSFVSQVYELFPVLSERRQQRAGSMSGGEQQMLALGMALMTRPKWLLLDEPSTGLAPVIVRNVMRRLVDINERMGVGLIVVEQNVPATLKVVQQVVILRSGQVAFAGSAAELAGNTDLWKWF